MIYLYGTGLEIGARGRRISFVFFLVGVSFLEKVCSSRVESSGISL